MKRRKGFTLVELVIVIAVIVILAAVLIPTFSGVIEKANNAKDYSLVSEMNKVLALEEATEGKNNTMYEATLDLKKYGMDIEKLPSSKGYSYVWNAKENRIALLNGENKLVFPEGEEIKDSNKTNYFAIARKESEVNGLYEAGYSVYLSESNPIVDVEAKQGFDAGNNTTATSVSYTNSGTQAKDVIIRTNSIEDQITINDESKLDTIHHYGKVGVIKILKCANESFHEYGLASFVQIKEGHFAIEKGAIVDSVYLETTNGAFGEIKISYDNTVDFPLISRSSVTIPSGSDLLVCELKEFSKSSNYIWLTNNGVRENVKSSSDKEGTIKEEILSDNEIMNTVANQIAFNEDGKDNSKEPSSEIGKTLFAGGTGTKNNPFLVNNENIANIQTLYKNNERDKTKIYYKLIEDIDMTSKNVLGLFGVSYYSVINADIDLDGHSINNLNTHLFSVTYYLNLHDGKISFCSNGRLIFAVTPDDRKIICSNLTLTGSTSADSVISNRISGITDNSKKYSIELINVNSYVNINCSIDNAVGGFIANGDFTEIMIENCNNYGNITAASSSAYGFVNGTPTKLVVKDSKYYGVISGSSNATIDYCSPVSSVEENVMCKGTTAAKGNVSIDDSLIIIDEETKEIKINAKAPYDKYVVYVDCYLEATPEILERFGYRPGIRKGIVITINGTEGEIVTGLYAYEFKNGQFDSTKDEYVEGSYEKIFTRVGIDNSYFIIDDFTYMVSGNNARIMVCAYQGENLLAVGTKNYNFN